MCALYPTNALGENFEQTRLARGIANRVWAWLCYWRECQTFEIYNELDKRGNHAGEQ